MSQPRRSVVNPLDLVVITRARLQEVLDEAVERGRITRGDAADLLAALLSEIGRAPIEVVAKLDGMSDADLRRVGAYEKANANRKTVLGAVERKLA